MLTIEERFVCQKKISSTFAPGQTYIPRPERPEWAPVALIGRVLAWKDQPLNPAWRVLRENGRTVEVLLAPGLPVSR